MHVQDGTVNCVAGLKNMFCTALLSSMCWWCKVNDLNFHCCFLFCIVSKASAGANISVHVNIEHAEGEIVATLALFNLLLCTCGCFVSVYF